MRHIAVRLHPGCDLRAEIEAASAAEPETAGFVAAAVGSLTQAQMRLANRDTGTRIAGPLELVALSGTLSPDGPHLHAAVADADGRVTGGHLLPGCTVRTTVKLVIGLIPDLRFSRDIDPVTGYAELKIDAAR